MIRSSFLGLLGKLWHRLNRVRRIQFFLLLALTLLASVAEVISIGAVIPLLGLMIEPEKLLNYPIIQSLFSWLKFSQPQQLVAPIAILFCCSVVGAGLLRLLLMYVSTNLALSLGTDLSVEAYRRTLYQPYSIHTNSSSSEIISGIVGKVGLLISSIAMPLLTLISSTFLLIAILFAMALVDISIAALSGAVFGGCYLIIAIRLRNRLRDNSECVARESTRVIKILQEGLGGIRDVLLDGTQDLYCKFYRDAEIGLRRAQAKNALIASTPRYFMEMVGIVLVVFLALGMSQKEGGLSTAVPVLGALALGAQRLMPILQQIYGSTVAIIGSQGSIRDASLLLDQPLPEHLTMSVLQPLTFGSEITLTNVSFSYGTEQTTVLNDINVKIPKGSKVGIVGATGFGKSTLVDVIMGLLSPTKGTLAIDGVVIDQTNIRQWQEKIAHVPQSIFLSDGSIETNIAFGTPLDRINFDKVKAAAHNAQISESVEAWPDGYNTLVGERGIRLSGGQRQRIGVARALYKDSEVLILDEATSALDSQTESAVMESIDRLDNGLTILIVAHRLNTLRQCDFIITMNKDGSCSQCGYGELSIKLNENLTNA